ncbi:MAG: hypothetical protein V7641_4315 [Blastocatellia bacterium]
MRKRWLLHFVLCMALAHFAAACRKVQPQTAEDGLHSQNAEPIEDSGRRLAGEFIVLSLADDYVANSVQAAPRWAFSFKEDGTFRSERDVRGTPRIEEGSYLISAPGELVLYIETVAGDALTDARLERYKIEAQSDAELRLRRNGAATLVLRRK